MGTEESNSELAAALCEFRLDRIFQHGFLKSRYK